MSDSGFDLHRPFGEVCCEDEIEVLREDYESYFFTEIPFSTQALSKDCYLIIGRRGTGKTSLAHFFSFQKTIPDARSIDVDEPDAYDAVMRRLLGKAGTADAAILARCARLWEWIVWMLLFREYRITQFNVGATVHAAKFLRLLLDSLVGDTHLNDDSFTRELDTELDSDEFEERRQKVLARVEKEPVIVAIDSLEHVGVGQDAEAQAIAGLVQAAARFNIRYSGKGIHLKVLLGAEWGGPHFLDQNRAQLRWSLLG